MKKLILLTLFFGQFSSAWENPLPKYSSSRVECIQSSSGDYEVRLYMSTSKGIEFRVLKERVDVENCDPLIDYYRNSYPLANR